MSLASWPLAWPRVGLWIAWGSVAVSVLASPWIAKAPVWVLVAPWALSVLVLGLPHGALDPFVPFRMNGQRLTPTRIAVFSVAYLGLAAVIVGIWLLAPEATALGFIALTWAHWGQGDVYALRALGWDAHITGRAHLALAGAVRGALPMVVPLAAQPLAYAEVLGDLVRVFNPESAGSVAASVAALAPEARVLCAALFGGYAVWSVLGAWGHLAWRPLALDLGEVTALVVFFSVLPPLWSVGVYFCAWHALRHLARLEPIVAPGQPGQFALLATPFTLGALALFAGLGWVLVERPDAGLLVAVYLIGIASVTVPHVAVVAWMDVRQGVWRPVGRGQ